MLETLIQKQTKLIRQAYENCNNGILDKLTTKAYLLQVELMYLRKFALNNPDKAAGQPEMVANDLAYYLGFYEAMGLGPEFDDVITEKIKKVTPQEIQEAANKYFSKK